MAEIRPFSALRYTEKAGDVRLQKTKDQLKSIKVGSYINFGAYEQDNDPANGKEDIEWLVLEIKGGKALEINTSRLYKELFRTQPDTDIIKRFYELGGEYITIGSDAHTPENIALGFEKAVQIAADIGFKYITYYKIN